MATVHFSAAAKYSPAAVTANGDCDNESTALRKSPVDVAMNAPRWSDNVVRKYDSQVLQNGV